MLQISGVQSPKQGPGGRGLDAEWAERCRLTSQGEKGFQRDGRDEDRVVRAGSGRVDQATGWRAGGGGEPKRRAFQGRVGGAKSWAARRSRGPAYSGRISTADSAAWSTRCRQSFQHPVRQTFFSGLGRNKSFFRPVQVSCWG